MSPPATLGQFEQFVLTAILALGEDAYGVTIHAKVQTLVTPKTVVLGAVYATLDRLEDKGLISSWLSDPTPARGGRSKRYYRLQAMGERALHDSVLNARRVCDEVERIWGAHTWQPGTKWKPVRQN